MTAISRFTWPRAEGCDHSQDADVTEVGHPWHTVLHENQWQEKLYENDTFTFRTHIAAGGSWTLTWQLRNTVSRLKNTAMAANPNINRGFLPIRSITKPLDKKRIRKVSSFCPDLYDSIWLSSVSDENMLLGSSKSNLNMKINKCQNVLHSALTTSTACRETISTVSNWTDLKWNSVNVTLSVLDVDRPLFKIWGRLWCDN